jgi:REP element-mobilizing transposase RayT
MPDHLHGLLKIPENAELSCIIQDLKGWSGNAINNMLGLKSAIGMSA